MEGAAKGEDRHDDKRKGEGLGQNVKMLSQGGKKNTDSRVWVDAEGEKLNFRSRTDSQTNAIGKKVIKMKQDVMCVSDDEETSVEDMWNLKLSEIMAFKENVDEIYRNGIFEQTMG